MPDSLMQRRLRNGSASTVQPSIPAAPAVATVPIAPITAGAPTHSTPPPPNQIMGGPNGGPSTPSPVPDPVSPPVIPNRGVPAPGSLANPAPVAPVASTPDAPHAAQPDAPLRPLIDATEAPRVLLTDAPEIPTPVASSETPEPSAPSPDPATPGATSPTTSSRLARLNSTALVEEDVASIAVEMDDDTNYAEYLAFEARIQQLLSANTEMSDLTKDKLKPQSQKRAREIIKGFVDADGHYPPGFSRSDLVQMIFHNVMGYGPIQPLLDDDTVDEVMVNSVTDIWVERKGKLQPVPGVRFRNFEHAKQIIDRILAPIGRQCDESHPLANGRLPNGSRVNAVVHPVALREVSMTIRKFREPMTPDKLLAYGSLPEWALDFIHACVTARLNILISGGTGSGKTSALNAFASFIPPDERIVSIEDAAELKLPLPHWVPLETKEANVEGNGAIPIRELVRNALRMRPDRIVVGECRGGEALDMLQAMNTGHEGSLTTVHANSAADSIKRLNVLVLMAGEKMPDRAINEQIASAINVIVQVARLRDGSRRTVAITEVVGMGKKKFADQVWTRDLFQFVETSAPGAETIEGQLVATGKKPHFLARLRQRGFDIPDSLFERSPLLPPEHPVEEAQNS